MDWLATEISKQQRRGVAAPFIFADLRYWLPEWLEGAEAPEAEPEASKEIQELARLMGAKGREPKNSIGLTQWTIAWQRHAPLHLGGALGSASAARYGIAAVVTDQLPAHAVHQHQEQVMVIAARAQAGHTALGALLRAPRLATQQRKRRVGLAVLYDTLVRKRWAERARSGEPDFSVPRFCWRWALPQSMRGVLSRRKVVKATGAIDASALRQAEEQYDQSEAANARERNERGQRQSGSHGDTRANEWEGSHKRKRAPAERPWATGGWQQNKRK